MVGLVATLVALWACFATIAYARHCPKHGPDVPWHRTPKLSWGLTTDTLTKLKACPWCPNVGSVGSDQEWI